MADLRGLSTSLNGLKMVLNRPTSDGRDSPQQELSEQDRQLILEAELDQVRQVNDTAEAVIESLKITELNLDVRIYSFLYAGKTNITQCRLYSRRPRTQTSCSICGSGSYRRPSTPKSSFSTAARGKAAPAMTSCRPSVTL